MLGGPQILAMLERRDRESPDKGEGRRPALPRPSKPPALIACVPAAGHRGIPEKGSREQNESDTYMNFVVS